MDFFSAKGGMMGEYLYLGAIEGRTNSDAKPAISGARKISRGPGHAPDY
jgi:hypothetical protein